MRPLALLCLLAACPGPGRTTSPSTPGAPASKRAPGDRQGRLVVLVFVDELPAWSFETKRPSFTGGFARLLLSGDWRTARLPALVSSSAAGKALIATGEPPATNGIVGDEWWERAQQRVVRADEPGGLRVPTLGDPVVAAHGKAVGVGVDAIGLRLVVGAHGRVLQITDAAAPQAAPDSPSDTAVLDAARAELGKDHLGRGHTTDLLAISLVDYARAAHAAGHDSAQAGAALLALDQQLAKLLEALDHEVGAGRWALVLTSDRGAGKPPARGHYTIEQLRTAANNAASLELGSGTDWIAWIQPPSLALNAGALSRSKTDLKRAMRKVIFALRAFPELAIVDRADAYEGHCAERTEPDKSLCNALDPARSGDFVFVPAPGWIIDSAAAPRATLSSSLDDADLLVPVLFQSFSSPPRAPAPQPHTAPTSEVGASQITEALRTWLAE